MKDLHHEATIFHAYGVFRSWLGIFYKDDKPRAFFKSVRTEIFVTKEVRNLAKTFGCGIFGLNQRTLRKGAESELYVASEGFYLCGDVRYAKFELLRREIQVERKDIKKPLPQLREKGF